MVVWRATGPGDASSCTMKPFHCGQHKQRLPTSLLSRQPKLAASRGQAANSPLHYSLPLAASPRSQAPRSWSACAQAATHLVEQHVDELAVERRGLELVDAVGHRVPERPEHQSHRPAAACPGHAGAWRVPRARLPGFHCEDLSRFVGRCR